MNGIHKIGSDGGGTVALTVPTTATNTTATLQAKDGTVALIDNVKGFKNYIINGGFDIWQRGSSFTANTTFSYMPDRFRIKTTTGSCAVQKNPTAGHSVYTESLGTTTYMTVASNNNGEIEISQPIENVRNPSGKNVTLSFNAAIYNGSQKDITVFIHQYFGTGGSPQVNSEVKTISVVGNDGLSKSLRYSTTFALPSVSGKQITDASQLVVVIRIPNGVYNFDIGKIQLEEGSIATPFENRPYGLELSLCQRYYETSGNARIEEFRNVITGSTQYGSVRFMVEKRSTPTLVVMNDTTMVAGTVSQDNGAPISVSINGIGNTGFRIQWTNTAGRFGASFHYTASAEL